MALRKLDLQVDWGTGVEEPVGGLPESLWSGQASSHEASPRETATAMDNLGLTDEQRANAGEIVQAIKSYV